MRVICDITFLVYHHQSMSQEDLIETVASYRGQSAAIEREQIEVILLLDGIKYEGIFEGVRVLPHQGREVGPGKLWNEGLKLTTSQWVVFTWTGAIWGKYSLMQLKEALGKKQMGSYGAAIYKDRSQRDSYTPKQVGVGELARQCVEFMNTIPLCYLLIDRCVVERIGGFRETLEVARIVDWEFTKRLSENVKLNYSVGQPIMIKQPINRIAFQQNSKQNIDEQIRVLIGGSNQRCTDKIAIIAGVTEGAQVQLCLLNYLERMSEELSYRRFLESDVQLEELVGYKIVFLIRSCSAKALEIAEFCLKEQIKVVYLLDDNWFCITETYPQLEGRMGRCSTLYFYFSLIISIVDKVWVYNERIAEDLKPYNSNVVVMPINISLKDFKRGSHQLYDEIRIGFAGSASKLQHFTVAFQALERIMQEFKQVKLYFKGIPVPSTLSKWGERVILESYNQNYKGYLKEVNEWQCEIMLSPLEDTRYINSKCVNKYLEITALGAVGIYTDIPLYRSVIKDGENGRLITNQEEAWYEAMKQLILDKECREKMKRKAYQAVQEKYDVKQVLPFFESQIATILVEEG